MTSKAELEDLIAAAGLGHRASFSRLYDLTSAKLFGVCLRVLNNQTAAEDALQDSFVKIWKHADRYQANGLSPMTWLITIARNTAIDRLRSERDTHSIDVMAEILPAPGLSPEGSAIAASEAGRIVECMGELPPDRRTALRECYLGGLSYQALATKFDVPLNTMRTWLRRSLAALKECMSR